MKNQNRKIFFFFSSENSRFVENGKWRILVLWKTKIGEFFFFYPRILVLLKRRILVLWKTGTGGLSFCGKTESENFFFFFFLSDNSRFLETQNSRFVENGNWRILVLWKTRIGEFFSFFFFYPRILVLLTRRILVLWKTGPGEFFFFFIREFCLCGEPESENLFFFLSENSRFLETENSRFVENGKRRILVLWKTRIGEIFFSFFIREFWFC